MRRLPSITIDQRPNGRFRVRWRENGRQREEGGFDTQAEADARRFQIEARFRSGLPGTQRRILIRELVARWWDDYVLTKSAATRTHYQTATRRVLSTIGAADAATMSTPRLIAWRDELEALLPTPRLVNDCLKVLSSAMQRGVEWGVVESNPVRGVPRLSEPDRSLVIPSREEVAALGLTAITSRERVRLCVAATVGLRPGEQLGLEWRHIGENVIRVEQSLKMNGRIGPTKTGRPRTVPAPRMVLDVLSEYREQTRHHRATDPVFASAHGARINPSRWRTESWYPWRSEAACEHLDWRTLRHYYAAAVAAAGGTMLQCSRWMGHASIATTANRYAYLFDEDAQVVMERLG